MAGICDWMHLGRVDMTLVCLLSKHVLPPVPGLQQQHILHLCWKLRGADRLAITWAASDMDVKCALAARLALTRAAHEHKPSRHACNGCMQHAFDHCLCLAHPDEVLQRLGPDDFHTIALLIDRHNLDDVGLPHALDTHNVVVGLHQPHLAAHQHHLLQEGLPCTGQPHITDMTFDTADNAGTTSCRRASLHSSAISYSH